MPFEFALVKDGLGACFCLPLELRIHQGFRHLGVDESHDKRHSLSLAQRVVQMGLAFATRQDRPAWLVLDAFFSTAGVFRLARSVYSIALKQPYLHILVRAKKTMSPISLRRLKRLIVEGLSRYMGTRCS